MNNFQRIQSLNTPLSRRWLAMTAVCALAGLVSWNWVIQKDISGIARLSKERTLIGTKQNTLKNIVSLEEKIKNFRGNFADTQETSWVIEALNQMAEESHVTLTGVTPQGASVKTEDYEKISVSVEMECTYHALGVFVSKLENHPMLLKISNIRISGQGGGAGAAGKLDVSAAISFFRPIGTLGRVLS